MPASPVVVFDVNETLSDMRPLAGRFADLGAPDHRAMLRAAGHRLVTLSNGAASVAEGLAIRVEPCPVPHVCSSHAAGSTGSVPLPASVDPDTWSGVASEPPTSVRRGGEPCTDISEKDLSAVSEWHVLDNPARASLLGQHSGLAVSHGRAVRYRPDVSVFVTLPDEPDDDAWRDVADLLGPGAVAPISGLTTPPPAGWEIVSDGEGVQLVDDGVAAAPDADAVRLGDADVPEMLALVARTRPGPFLPRTIEMGTYLGIRLEGRLVAMAGERLHPPGFTEISAVCTDAEFRGRGLGTRLVHAVAAGIRERGETPMLHAAAGNVGAIALYEHLGFRLRRRTRFLGVRVPAGVGTPS